MQNCVENSMVHLCEISVLGKSLCEVSMLGKVMMENVWVVV